MGVKERKERERGDMKELILSSAHRLFVDKGFEEVSIRNIAEAIEYSPATIYLYFKDKNEIIHALHQQGFRILNERFQPLAKLSDPFQRLNEMGREYIKFATSNPSMYELLFIRSEPMKHVTNCLDEEWQEGDRAFDALLQTVKQCQGLGYFAGLDTNNLSMMIWSFVHGLCALRISGHLGHVKEARENPANLDIIMSNTFEAFQAVLEKLKS